MPHRRCGTRLGQNHISLARSRDRAKPPFNVHEGMRPHFEQDGSRSSPTACNAHCEHDTKQLRPNRIHSFHARSHGPLQLPLVRRHPPQFSRCALPQSATEAPIPALWAAVHVYYSRRFIHAHTRNGTAIREIRQEESADHTGRGYGLKARKAEGEHEGRILRELSQKTGAHIRFITVLCGDNQRG